MKKVLFCFLYLFIITLSLEAQTIIETLRFSPTSHIVIKKEKTDNGTAYNIPLAGNMGNGVGQRWYNLREEDYYYSFFVFNVGTPLPNGTTIQSVTFHAITRDDIQQSTRIRMVGSLDGAYSTWIDRYNTGTVIMDIPYGNNSVNTTNSSVLSWLEGFTNNLVIGGAIKTPHDDPYFIDTAKISLEIVVVIERPVQQITYTVKNVMDAYNGGQIGVGINEPVTVYQSPKQITTMENNIINLRAYNNTNPNTGEYYTFNEVANPVQKSSWKKSDNAYNVTFSEESACSIVASYEPKNVHYGNIIGAYLKPAWAITKNYNTEFNDVYSSEDLIAKGNTATITAPLNETINDKPYKFAGWLDNGSTSNERTLTPTANITLSPRYKYPTHSNQTTGYSSNSQRKLIKTDSDGNLHSVYTSMDKVWYEMSTDNGVTWSIMNNGCPLSGNDSKNPSITDAFNGHNVLIAFQENNQGEYKIKILSINYITDIIQDNESFDIAKPYSVDSHPVAYFSSYQGNSALLLLWEESNAPFLPGGIHYFFGQMDGLSGQNINFANNAISIIPNTDESCLNPTVMGSRVLPITFHIAYQQNTSSTTSKIWYDSVNVDTDGFDFVNNRKEVSYGSGFTKNYNPSIIEINGGARVVWIGERTEAIIDKDADPTSGSGGTASGSTTVRSVVFKSPQYYRFWNFGSNPQYPTITKSSDNLTYIVAWNEITTGQNKFVNNQLNAGDIKNFGINGNCVQVANALNKQGMLGLVFDASTSPYSFNKTSNIGSFYPKAGNSGLSVNYGRQGLVGKDSLQFYFAIGDIIKDQQHIKFINLPEEFAVNSLESLNYALISEAFVINDGESFVYSVQYGMVGNQYAQLSDGKQVNFKVKLIDANTGELLRVFDNVTYSGSNLQNYNNILYQVSVNEIGSKTVKMCLEVNDNLNGFYTVTDKMNDEDVFAKLNTKEVNLVENIEITSYDLFQNYPNPFNPSTTISYQVPDNCRVTLKVFDVLGKEVTTLVDEYKSKGKYDVQFNAKHLASGMYIYQIKAGDFVSSKKLMLMK